MKNSTSAILEKLCFSFAFILITILGNAQTYSTAFGDWSTEWSSNSGIYQATGGPGLYSFGSTATDGQVNSRNFTSDGTTSGTNKSMMVGQKLTIKVSAPIGGGRSGIQSGGRIGFALKNKTSFYSGADAQARFFDAAMLRFEYEGGQAASQLVDGGGTIRTGMPGFSDFTNGQTYEVEVISDKEFNFQVVSGSRLNIRSFTATGQLQQISIADLGLNRDGVFENLAISDMTTVGLTANSGDNFTVSGVISNKSNNNTVTKYGVGTVVLTGQNTYSGLTTVSAGTLQLNGASANTIKTGNAVSVANGATLRISQDQTFGSVTLPAGANLVVDAGKTLTINGIFISGGNIQNNGTIKLGGSLPQSFPGSGTVSAMNNLIINNTSASLDAASLKVTGTLSFVAKGGSPAILTTGSNVITAASVSGASAANGWVNGNLARSISASGAVGFDIGDASNYLPVGLNIDGSGFTAGDLQVSTSTPLNAVSGYSSLSLGTTNTINRAWSIFKPSGSTFAGSYSGTYNYLAADVVGSPNYADLRQGVYNGATWVYPGVVSNSGLQITQSALVSPASTGNVVFGSSQPVTISGISATAKVYDAGTSANLDFSTAVANGLLNGDVVTVGAGSVTGVYDDKNVGTGKNVTLSGTATLNGTQAGAYSISSMQASTSGDITPMAIEVTATANTKPYDGNVSATAVPTISNGSLQGSDVANFSETYTSPNAGTGKTLVPAGTVTDGNSGNNYSYSFVSSSNGVITNIPIANLTATPGSIPCSGGTTTMVVSATGGDGQLMYSLTGPTNFPPQASTSFTGVGAGTYTLTVTDEDGFSAQLSGITVSEPQTMSASFVTKAQSVCAVTPDGSVTVTPNGGTAPFTYTWTGVIGSGNPATTPYANGTNNATQSNLMYGFYNVHIADANGCNIDVNNIHVGKAFAATITHNGSISSACGATGSLIIYAAGGVAPYTYSLDGSNFQVSNSFTALAAGPYTIYVKDDGGCVTTKAITLGQAAPIVITNYVGAASSCSNDGSIMVYRSGGIPPYTYSLDGVNYQGSNSFLNLAAGSYTVHVKDSKNCDYSQAAVVPQGAGLSLTIRKSDASACINDGSIQVVVSGGAPGFSYSLNGGPAQQSNSFSGLAAGNYVVSVTDSRGCTGTTNVSININTISVTFYKVDAPSCAGTGSITLYRTGGIGPYTYSLDGNNYQASSVFTGLTPGTYTGYVKDSKTCVGSTAENAIVVGPENCNNNARGSKPVMGDVTSLSVSAFPNPTANEFMLNLKGFQMNERVSITVTDLLGRIVLQEEGAGKMQYQIGKKLLSGVYNVSVAQGEKRVSVKLVKE